jgi:hypothetical protein
MMLAMLQSGTDSGTDWPDAMIATAGVVMVTAIVVIVIWQIAASWRARVSVERETAYRELVSQSAVLEEQLLAEQRRVASDLSAVRQRVENIERILREVE